MDRGGPLGPREEKGPGGEMIDRKINELDSSGREGKSITDSCAELKAASSDVMSHSILNILGLEILV